MFHFQQLTTMLTSRRGRTHRPQPGMGDLVNRPAHYTVHPVFTGECHDYAKHMTFDQGNAFKYLWRCAAKGDMVENVRKALWYLNAMRTGPVLARCGNRLPRVDVDKLATEYPTRWTTPTARVPLSGTWPRWPVTRRRSVSQTETLMTPPR